MSLPAVPITTRPERSTSCSDASASRRARSGFRPDSSTASSRSRCAQTRSSASTGRAPASLSLAVRHLGGREPSTALAAVMTRLPQVRRRCAGLGAGPERHDPTCDRSAFCVSRRCRNNPPAARTAAVRSRSPKPSKLWTRKWSMSDSPAARESNVASSASVTTRPNAAISGRIVATWDARGSNTSRGRRTLSSSRAIARPPGRVLGGSEFAGGEVHEATPRRTPVVGVAAWPGRGQPGVGWPWRVPRSHQEQGLAFVE